MGAGHSYSDKDYLLIDDTDIQEDFYEEEIERIFDVGETHNFEIPVEPGVEEQDVSVYLYKRIDFHTIFDNIDLLVGLKSDNYNTILVSQIHEDFVDFDIKNSDTTDILYFLEQFGDGEFVGMYDSLNDELDNLNYYQDNNAIEYIEDIKNSIKEILKQTNLLSDFANTYLQTELKENNNILKIISKQVENLENISEDKLFNFLKSITANMDSLFEQLKKIIENEYEKVINKSNELTNTILTEIIISNPKGMLRHSTSAWTSETARYYGTTQDIEKFIKEEKEIGNIPEYRQEKFNEIEKDIAYDKKQQEAAIEKKKLNLQKK